MRHAKSDWDPSVANDFDRPLSKRGRRAAKQIGRWLRQQSMLPDQVVCSTANRAQQTARRVCHFAEIDPELIVWESQIYEASLETLLTVVSNRPAHEARCLLIGHNPGLDYLVRYLADDSLDAWDAGNLLPTATVARLLMPADWSALAPACAEVASINRPRKLFDD